MSSFKSLSKPDQELLISVPYRTGIWISNADDVETRKVDDKRERQVLAMMIKRMASSHRKMPFASGIMKYILSAESRWGTWQNNAEEAVILEDIDKAVKICRDQLSPRHFEEYKKAVWQIGLSVAHAFDESADPDGEMHVNHFFEWIASFIAAPKFKKAPENISDEEKTALKKLQAVLKQ